MPWYNGDYPPSYKNQPKKLRHKAVKIANEMLKEGVVEGIAIATALSRQESILIQKTKATRTKCLVNIDETCEPEIIQGHSYLRTSRT